MKPPHWADVLPMLATHRQSLPSRNFTIRCAPRFLIMRDQQHREAGAM
jgi:hypothetical protein